MERVRTTTEKSKTKLVVDDEVRAVCVGCGGAIQMPNAIKCDACENVPLMQTASAGLIGKILDDKYEILAEIGAGGWGVVYKARQIELDRIVAVKVLRKHLINDRSKLMRFKQEAYAASRLVHTNIAQVFDYGVFDRRQPFFVMEYLEGQSLDKFLAQEAELDTVTMNAIFAQTLAALAFAHGQGVIHRDIKPGNILVRTSENGVTVKLVDFGIARLMERQEEEKNLTATGELLGTPLYMSPEQCVGEHIDFRSDLYSLACVMYESVTGYNPFAASNSFECMMRHTNGVTPDVTLADGTICDASVQAFFRKALAKEPGARYQSAEEMAKDLASVPLPSRHQSVSSTSTRKSEPEKNRLAWLSLLCLATVLLVVGGFSRGIFSGSDSAPSTQVNPSAVDPVAVLPAIEKTGANASDNASDSTQLPEPGENETHEEGLKRELTDLEEYVKDLRGAGKTGEAARVQSALDNAKNMQLKASDLLPNSKPALHVVAIKDGKPLRKFSTDKFAKISVTCVNGPFDLLLSSDNISEWQISLAPGAQLRKIFLHGSNNNSQVIGLPKSVPIERIASYDENEYSNIFTPQYKDDDEYDSFLQWVKSKLNRDITTIVVQDGITGGCTVGAENSEWLSSYLRSYLAPFYRQAKSYLEDKLTAKLKGQKFWALHHVPNAGASGNVEDNCSHFISQFDYTGVFDRTSFKMPCESNTVCGALSGPVYAGGLSGIFQIDLKTKAAKRMFVPPDIPDPTYSSTFQYDPVKRLLYCATQSGHVEVWNELKRNWTVASAFSRMYGSGAIDTKSQSIYAFSNQASKNWRKDLYQLAFDGSLKRKIVLSRPVPYCDSPYAPQQMFYKDGYLVLITTPIRFAPMPVYMIVIDVSNGRICYWNELKHNK